MGPRSPLPIHGRDDELDALGGMLVQARAGDGGALTIASGPGMGRTTLLAETVRRAGPDVLTLGTRGVRHEASVPFAGLHGLVRPLVRPFGRLPNLLSRLPAAQARTLTTALANGADPAEVGTALPAAVHALLAEAARAGPLLCWIDDVHWMDRVSLEALAFAARRMAADPIVMVFTVRDDPPVIAGRQPLDAIPRLAVGPLEEAASLRVLADLTGGPGVLDEGLAEELAELAGGCPRALVDLVAGLMPAQLSGDAPPPRELPGESTLRVYYRRRRRRLPPGARRLAMLVAAGERLELGTIARAATAEGIALGALEMARNAGLVRIEGNIAEPPSPLVRSCLYADAPLAERRSAHALLARVLDQDRHRHQRSLHRAALALEPDERLAGELAAAARTAGTFADSSRVWERAAELTTEPGLRSDRLLAAASDAWTAGRPRRARALLRRVRAYADTTERVGRADLLQGEIELADGLPATAVDLLMRAARQLRAADPEAAARALVNAGEAADMAGDHHSHVLAAEQAASLPAPRGAEHRLALAHLSGMGKTLQGRPREAAVRLDEVLRLADTVDDCAALIWASAAALAHGRHHRARALATLAVTGARQHGAAPLSPSALTMLARCEMALGRYPVAVAVAWEGACAARATGQRNREAELLATLALLAAFLGDTETCLQRLHEMGTVVGGRGLNRAAAYATWAHGFLALAEDSPADAAARLKRLTGGGTAHIIVRTVAIPHFVEAAVRCGRRRAAARAFTFYEHWVAGSSNPAGEALTERCRALLTEDENAAGAHFDEALRMFREGDSPHELARTELLYGQRLRRDRRPRDAREHLRTALELFEQVGAHRWAERARTELRAAGDTLTPDIADADLEALTAQQLRIARLVADGATNKEIASRLVISPRTVDHHLRNVFTRLGIRSRVELAKLVR
ncbi:LuxR family transcriptional regulator [Spirillospora sp. NPDC047279]|uniref:LuxR family transcriptional regulator n=1 Tax=Spirillospora sp. NPDC047279 TaxID=3155478 RepID=UPI0033D49EBA